MTRGSPLVSGPPHDRVRPSAVPRAPRWAVSASLPASRCVGLRHRPLPRRAMAADPAPGRGRGRRRCRAPRRRRRRASPRACGRGRASRRLPAVRGRAARPRACRRSRPCSGGMAAAAWPRGRPEPARLRAAGLLLPAPLRHACGHGMARPRGTAPTCVAAHRRPCPARASSPGHGGRREPRAMRRPQAAVPSMAWPTGLCPRLARQQRDRSTPDEVAPRRARAPLRRSLPSGSPPDRPRAAGMRRSISRVARRRRHARAPPAGVVGTVEKAEGRHGGHPGTGRRRCAGMALPSADAAGSHPRRSARVVVDSERRTAAGSTHRR